MPGPSETVPRITDARGARAFFHARLAGLAIERLCVAHLDHRGHVLGETRLDGGPGHAAIPIRRIVADALKLEAEAMLLAHNHPGGTCAASRADLQATRRLASMADALGIHLRDHLIMLRDGQALSLRAQGLL